MAIIKEASRMVAGTGTLTVSEELKQRIKNFLLASLADKENLEWSLLEELRELGSGKEDFDREGSQYADECRKIHDRINRNSRDMKKDRDGLESLDNGTFTGICNGCRHPVPEKELLGDPDNKPPIPANPTRKLCSSCQAKINNR